jgi:hypothetical protein
MLMGAKMVSRVRTVTSDRVAGAGGEVGGVIGDQAIVAASMTKR